MGGRPGGRSQPIFQSVPDLARDQQTILSDDGGDITVESKPGAASLCYLAERWRGCSPHSKVDRLAALSRRFERSFSGPCSLIKLFFQFRIDASKTSSHFPSKIHVLNSALH